MWSPGGGKRGRGGTDSQWRCLQGKLIFRQKNSKKDFTVAAAPYVSITSRWNPISSVPWKDLSGKDVKYRGERLVKKQDLVQLHKNGTHGWCKITSRSKDYNKKRRDFYWQTRNTDYVQWKKKKELSLVQHRLCFIYTHIYCIYTTSLNLSTIDPWAHTISPLQIQYISTEA